MQQTRQGYIYALTSKTTGKVYVGQTVQRLNDRLTEHWYFAERGSRTHFACALRKYGLDDFVLEVLETCAAPDLNDREIHHVTRLRANDRRCGYNMSAGGDGGRNSLSPEVRRRISETKRKQALKFGPLSPERKAKIRAALVGKTRTEEQKERIRNSRPYPPLTETHKQRISDGLRRTRRFSLSEELRVALYSETLTEPSDQKLAEKYGVSRKLVWRMRHDVRGCAPHSEAA